MSCVLREERRLLRAVAGDVAAAWSRAGGGALALEHAASRVQTDVFVDGTLRGAPVAIRQSADPTPELLPLEEGPGRVGVRSLFALLGPDDELLGEGFQDAWVTRHGEVLLSLGLSLAAEGLTVEHAALHLSLTGVEAVERRGGALAAQIGDAGLLLTWPQGSRHSETLLWQGPRPPFYQRWPPLFDQWSLDPATSGWNRLQGGGPFIGQMQDGSAEIGLAWLDESAIPAAPQLDLRGLAWLGLGRPQRLEQLARAHAQPLAPTVQGGRLRAYEELDGAYEIGASGDDCTIEFPPDPERRPLRVRVFGLAATGGFEADGAELTLLSERGRVDDPLVSVEVAAEGRADEALLVVEASEERPTRVELRRRGGLHVAYQRRDPRRRLTVHHPADLERPVATVELASLHLRDVRLPGRARPALHALPLFWMRYLPKASAHVADRLADLEVLEQSGELVTLRLESATPGGSVRSRYTIEVPYRDHEFELRIRAELTGAASWGLPTFEYADIFPEDGIDPSRWEYRRLALVRDDEVRVVDPKDPYPGLVDAIEFPQPVLDAMPVAHGLRCCGPFPFSPTGAVVFEGSARGTIVAIARSPCPGELEHIATLCEHWADIHFDVAAVGARPVASERQSEQLLKIPDTLEAELTLHVLDPDRVSFEDALELARAACAQPIKAAS